MRVHRFIKIPGVNYTSHLSHIIIVLFIPNEFPRLLAKREIIANAYVFITMSGNLHTQNGGLIRCKVTKIKRDGNHKTHIVFYDCRLTCIFLKKSKISTIPPLSSQRVPCPRCRVQRQGPRPCASCHGTAQDSHCL